MSLIKTFMQDIRAKYPSNNDRDELRITQDGILTSVLSMTNSPSSIVSPELMAQANASVGRNLDIPVMQKGVVTISNARSCTITGGQSESDLVRVTWKTLSANILMVPSQYGKNEITYQADLAKKIREVVEAFKVEIENDLDSAFDANKSQVYGSSIVGDIYTLTANAIQVEPSQVDFFFNDVDAINFADDFNDPTIKVIGNHRVMSVVRKLQAQADMNATNTAFQFFGKDFTFSNRITNGAGVQATGYFMPDGSVGLLTRVDIDSQLGHVASDGTEWAQELLPGLPFPVGIQYKSKCDNKSTLEASGLGHLTATMVEMWQISFDFAIVVPYNSDITTNPSSIRKFEFIPTPVTP